MSSRAELANKILADFDAETSARIMAQLNAGVPTQAVASAFGVSPRALRALTPPKRPGVLGEENGTILDVLSAGQPQKWCERDRTLKLSPYGEAERARRVEQALRVDSLLCSLGLSRVSTRAPIVVERIRPERLFIRQGVDRAGLFAPRHNKSRDQIPTIDDPPWGEE